MATGYLAEIAEGGCAFGIIKLARCITRFGPEKGRLRVYSGIGRRRVGWLRRDWRVLSNIGTKGPTDGHNTIKLLDRDTVSTCSYPLQLPAQGILASPGFHSAFTGLLFPPKKGIKGQ